MPPPRKVKDYDNQDRPDDGVVENEAVQVHAAYLEHRLGGGRKADPEAYRRAVEQFERLPGAVRTAPSASRLIEQAQDAVSGDEQSGSSGETGTGS
jgi:hypothetical protein